jgi:transposase
MALTKGGELKEEDQNYLDFLLKKSPEIKELAILANEFKELFSMKKEGSLKEWITKALPSESGLKGFAKGINSDFDAVDQAVTSTISNGQVEGQVNRLKTIKRKMYGRTGYHPLRKMVLANSG